ncbi:MAG TPA: chemotaxis protein CheW [Nitrospiraceae bacterium]|jgi:purine-binding chemotaxis protein CheW
MGSAQQSLATDNTQDAQEASSSQAGQPRTGGSSTMRVAIISFGGELFTIDLKSVREVFIVESITPVPGMPSGFVGVTNLRGTIIPLLDLRPMFGLDAGVALQYAVVLQHSNWQIGILVDTVPKIHTLSKDQFFPAPTGTGEGVGPFVSSVVKMDDRLRGVLETSMMLSYLQGTS